MTSSDLDRVEAALGFRLYPYQRTYLLTGKLKFPTGRKTGWTTAHCLHVILTPGDGIGDASLWSDYGDGTVKYRRFVFPKIFWDVWHRLDAAGIPVRPK